MGEVTTGWDWMHLQQFQKSRSAFESRPDFAAIVDEAKKRGFRRITLAEQIETGSADAYSWRGGVWVKDKEQS